MTRYKAIGIMSGTSLDGLDIALCYFYLKNKSWEFDIIKATTITYSDYWRNSLSNATNLDAFNFIKLHKEFGSFIGNSIKKLLGNKLHGIDIIASHGHTIFHQPKNLITYQLGDGNQIVTKTGITTICDFRSMDVALGGEGAPLVPIGDKYLFNEFDYCLNLGGFANISFDKDSKRIAFDICPVNIVINSIIRSIGVDFDQDGKIAKKGTINNDLLNKLNHISFYNTPPPKSLGKEWLEINIMPIVNNCKDTIENKLRTIYEHIVIQINKVLEKNALKKILVTGGGAHNKYLAELLKSKIKATLIIPDQMIIDYKEALIFAFLGILKLRGEINCLSSVTGAKTDSSTGIIYDIK